MAYINWTKTFEASVEVPLSPPFPAVEISVDVPTYGLNGGADYTAGTFNPDDSVFAGQPVGVDALDLLFFEHDFNSVAADTPAEQAAADYELLQDLINLDRTDLADPEASLYAGAAELGMIVSLALAGVDATPDEAVAATSDAVLNIAWGLKHLESEEHEQAQEWFAEVAASVQVFEQTLDFFGVSPPTVTPVVAELFL